MIYTLSNMTNFTNNNLYLLCLCQLQFFHQCPSLILDSIMQHLITLCILTLFVQLQDSYWFVESVVFSECRIFNAYRVRVLSVFQSSHFVDSWNRTSYTLSVLFITVSTFSTGWRYVNHIACSNVKHVIWIIMKNNVILQWWIH